MFKRTLLAAVALSMLAAPMAQAQTRYDAPGGSRHYSQPAKPAYKAPQRHHAQKPAPQRHDARRNGPGSFHAGRPAPVRHHWAKGQRVPDWQRRQHVRDYGRHGLRAPARGQQWVKVDNDYLLVSLATGLILGLAAAR